MPKAIKKRIITQTRNEEDEVKSALEHFTAKIKERQRNVVTVAVIALAVLIVVFVAVSYFRGQKREAQELQYQGYKLFEGINDAKDIPAAERMRQAVEKFTASAKLDPSPFTLYYLALANERTGDIAAAETAHKELLTRYPGDPRFLPLATYRLGMLAIYDGKNDEALQYFDRFSQFKAPMLKDAALIESARLLETMGKKDLAAEKYKKLLDEFPNSSFSPEARERLVPSAPAGLKGKPGGSALSNALSR